MSKKTIPLTITLNSNQNERKEIKLYASTNPLTKYNIIINIK